MWSNGDFLTATTIADVVEVWTPAPPPPAVQFSWHPPRVGAPRKSWIRRCTSLEPKLNRETLPLTEVFKIHVSKIYAKSHLYMNTIIFCFIITSDDVCDFSLVNLRQGQGRWNDKYAPILVKLYLVH